MGAQRRSQEETPSPAQEASSELVQNEPCRPAGVSQEKGISFNFLFRNNFKTALQCPKKYPFRVKKKNLIWYQRLYPVVTSLWSPLVLNNLQPFFEFHGLDILKITGKLFCRPSSNLGLSMPSLGLDHCYPFWAETSQKGCCVLLSNIIWNHHRWDQC